MNDKKNEKYEFLYQYSKSLYDDELVRFKNIEDKASKFIGLLSIMIVGYTAIVRFSGGVFFPPESSLETITLLSIVFAFLALLRSWFFLFSSLRFIEIARLPLTDEIFDNFRNKDFVTNHYILSRTCREALEHARGSNAQKTEPLIKAYKFMKWTAWLLSISLLLLAVSAYSKNGDTIMQDSKNESEQTTPAPSEQATPAPSEQTTQVPEPDFRAVPPKTVLTFDYKAPPKPK